MTQGCLKCLKYTMCAVNFLCFICGTVVFGFGLYMMMNIGMSSLIPSLANLSLANILIITGIIITCVSLMGFLGALKENRCLLMTFFLLLFILMLVKLAAACLMLVYGETINNFIEKDLAQSLQKSIITRREAKSNLNDDWDVVQAMFKCCGVHNETDWGKYVPNSCCAMNSCSNDTDNAQYYPGCLDVLRNWFEDNFLIAGISVIVICVIEVLGMCIAMTLFCHIRRSGLGYKL